MSLKHALSLGFLLTAALAATACGDSSSGSAPASGASGAATAKPTATAAATATATAAATPTATATAAPAAPAIVGIAADEMLAATCESISKDSECTEVVVKAEGEKAKSMDAMKKLCSGTVSDKACSTDKIVGTCRIMKDMITHYSSDGPKKHTVDTAKKVCEKSRGKWVSP